jgi:HPt (histidine-containing phosphotransfer) domain-containing protein
MVGDREALARLLAEAGAEYRRTLPGRLAEIEVLWLAKAKGTLPAEKFEELQRLVHTIAGSARTFGLPAVSEAARALELAISSSDGPAENMPADGVERARKLVEALKQSASNG